AQEAMTYLIYVAPGVFFILLTQVYSSIYNGLANTKIVLAFITVGLILNMVLDPLFILTFNQGVQGAAIATSISGAVPCILFTIYTKKYTTLFNDFKSSLSLKHAKTIFKLSFIPAIQNITFTLVMFAITRIITGFGANALAAQRIGNQVESMGWMIGLAISSATSIFVSQNYGAKEYQRVITGYKTIVLLFVFYGIFITYLFVFQAKPIFSLFLNDEQSLQIGVAYLQIVGAFQLLQLFEMITNGFFNGIGKTLIPGIVSFVGNFIRIPLALLLTTYYGLDGVWYALGISMVFKGSMMLLMFILSLIKSDNFNLGMLVKK
ncbi:MAG: MATE family efflux transporter, partial [Bacilli bacterium]